MRGRSLFAAILIIIAVVVAFFFLRDRLSSDRSNPLIREAMVECKTNLEFLDKCRALINESGGEENAMVRVMGNTKFQLKAKALNDLLRQGAAGKNKEALARISDEIDSYNGELTAVFYLNSGNGNISISRPASPPTTEHMIREFRILSGMLEK